MNINDLFGKHPARFVGSALITGIILGYTLPQSMLKELNFGKKQEVQYAINVSHGKATIEKFEMVDPNEHKSYDAISVERENVELSTFPEQSDVYVGHSHKFPMHLYIKREWKE